MGTFPMEPVPFVSCVTESTTPSLGRPKSAAVNRCCSQVLPTSEEIAVHSPSTVYLRSSMEHPGLRLRRAQSTSGFVYFGRHLSKLIGRRIFPSVLPAVDGPLRCRCTRHLRCCNRDKERFCENLPVPNSGTWNNAGNSIVSLPFLLLVQILHKPIAFVDNLQ